MAWIDPTSVSNNPETFTKKRAYIKLTITSISDSDATTNERYVGWKLTVEGTPWVQLSAYYCSLGGQILAEKYTNTNNWNSGQTLASGTKTFSNDSAGNLSLYAYVKQLFYYGFTQDRWNNANRYQDKGVTMVCSQLPRYANFTRHYVSETTLNTLSVHWEVDANCDVYQYSLNGGAWTDCSWPNYTISGLSPDTQYNIRTRVRRTDSQLWTTSDYIYGTTAKLPVPNNIADVNLPNPVYVSINSMANLTNWYIKIYDGNNLVRDGSDTPSTSTNDYWSIWEELYNPMLSRHPNDNYWNLTIKFYCLSNGTTYEFSTKTVKYTIPQNMYIPSFNANNISYVVTDSLSNNITGSNQKVIKGISDIQVTCAAASPQGGSSMKSYNATSGSKTASTTNLSSIVMNLTDVDSSSVTVQAVDTRNRTTNATKTFVQYIEYSKPNATLNIVRYDGIGQNLVFNIVGSFYKWSGLEINNSIQSIQYQYKLKGQPDSSYSSPINITGITYSDNVFTVNSVGSDNHFDTDKEYTVKISITDKLTTVSYITDIPTGRALVWKDLANYRIGIGKKPSKTLDVAGDINTDGALYVNGVKMIWYE